MCCPTKKNFLAHFGKDNLAGEKEQCANFDWPLEDDVVDGDGVDALFGITDGIGPS